MTRRVSGVEWNKLEVVIYYNIIALLLHKVLDLNMTASVFNLKYLSFYWVKIQK